MGNRNAREWQQRQDDLRAWHLARTVTRPLHQEVRLRGVGTRRLQVAHLPSFDPGSAWDVRTDAGTSRVFHSHLRYDSLEPVVAGYEELHARPGVVEEYLDWFATLALPICPPPVTHVGLDGVRFELAVFGDLWSAVRFQWWSEPPEVWKPLGTRTAALIAELRTWAPLAGVD